MSELLKCFSNMFPVWNKYVMKIFEIMHNLEHVLIHSKRNILT